MGLAYSLWGFMSDQLITYVSISYVLGAFKFNTDAAEFIPQERKNSGLYCGSQRRLDSNRIGRRNYSSPPPCHLSRQISYDDISAVHQHSFHPSGGKPKSQQTSFQSSVTNKSLKNHGLQNQPWQKLRSEKQHIRVKRAQGLTDQTSEGGQGAAATWGAEMGTQAPTRSRWAGRLAQWPAAVGVTPGVGDKRHRPGGRPPSGDRRGTWFAVSPGWGGGLPG